MESKQVIQSKAAYGHIKEAIRWDSPSIAPEPDISVSWSRTGYTMTEPAGRHGNPYQFKLNPERLFVHKDRPYIYRCNLYNPTLKLCRMSAACREFSERTTTQAARGGVTECSEVDKLRILGGATGV